MNKIALAASVVALQIAALNMQAFAATLYQWTGEDGTPTYSVEPPPRGVQFVVIGSDLKPTPNQPSANQPSANQNGMAATQVTSPTAQPKADVAAGTVNAQALPSNFSKPTGVVIAPTPAGMAQTPNKINQPTAAKPAAPKTKWKPVVYADDPNPQRKPEPAVAVPTPATNNDSGLITSECMQVRKHLAMLEGVFANASTPESMDRAVIELSRFKRKNAQVCNLR